MVFTFAQIIFFTTNILYSGLILRGIMLNPDIMYIQLTEKYHFNMN